jgi:hypothetical protein
MIIVSHAAIAPWMKWESFRKWFNRDFWRAFKSKSIPLCIPPTKEERSRLVREVYESILSARYSVDIPETEIVINKGHGVARTVPVFNVKDYIVYYFCIKELEPILAVNRTQNTFGGWALGGKLRCLEEDDLGDGFGEYDSRYAFDPKAWSAAFGEFNSLLYAQLDTLEFSYVLQFDLSNFYDSIRLDILERWIREESDSSKGWIIALLFYFLNQWNRKRTGLHPQAVGIPQDALADCSRILANYYLQKYDLYAERQCVNANAIYFRYSDDQMILLRNQDNYQRLLLLLTRRLDQYGLRVNQKKVYLWEKEELENHRLRALHGLFKDKEDIKSSELTQRFAASYLSIDNEYLKSSWNSGLPALNRLLWANIPSLNPEQQAELLKRYTSEEYLAKADYKKLKRIYSLIAPENKASFMEELLCLSDRLVHNSFHYEIYFFGLELDEDAFCAKVQERIKAISSLMDTSDLAMRNY